MEYYIKAKNNKTGKSMVMSTPVFTNKKKAQEFADNFAKLLAEGVGELTVIRKDER